MVNSHEWPARHFGVVQGRRTTEAEKEQGGGISGADRNASAAAMQKMTGVRARFRKIGVFGNFGSGNLGNEGSLQAMMNFLEEVAPDAKITCICPGPEAIRRKYGVTAHAMQLPRKGGASIFGKVRARIGDLALMIRRVRDFDVMIIPGTGILDDFGEPPHGMPLRLFTACLVARLRGTKTVFVSIGAGPIVHPLSRWLLKSAAKMAHYCSFRDQFSRDFMASLGMDTSNCPIFPDLAFLLPEPANLPASKNNRLRVGVGLMSYRGWVYGSKSATQIYEDYRDKVVSFVRWLLGNGYEVRLLVGEDSDERVVQETKEALSREAPASEEGRVVAEPVHSLFDLMNQIAQTDIVVATRFHNVICALKMGRPALSIGYSMKNDVLQKEMGLQRFCQQVENLDRTLLVEQFRELAANLDYYQETLQKMKRIYADRLSVQNQLLTDIISIQD
jgi:polysaccharide pyruvyl transferase WcaK-like protein